MVLIDKVSYGEISIGGKTYYSDLVIWWSGKVALLPKTHLIDPPLLKKILKPETEILLIGLGLEGTVRILPSVEEELKKKKIKLLLDKTENALEIFNGLAILGKKIIAVMHVTL